MWAWLFVVCCRTDSNIYSNTIVLVSVDLMSIPCWKKKSNLGAKKRKKKSERVIQAKSPAIECRKKKKEAKESSSSSKSHPVMRLPPCQCS